MKRIIIAIIAVVLLSSCREYDIDEVLLQRDDISMTLDGKTVFSFDEKTCQLGYNDMRHEYRVHDDAIGNWFIIRCSAEPTTEGQEVKADLSWTAATTTKTRKGLKFVVKKVDGDHIWMWCKSDNIGVVVKDI